MTPLIYLGSDRKGIRGECRLAVLALSSLCTRRDSVLNDDLHDIVSGTSHQCGFTSHGTHPSRRPAATGTIDEKIYQRQMTKIGLSDSLMDQKEQAGTNQFTTDDLRDLFTLDDTTDCQTHDLLECKCLGGGASVKRRNDGMKSKFKVMDDSVIAELNEWTHLPAEKLNELEDDVLVRALRGSKQGLDDEDEVDEDADYQEGFDMVSFGFCRKSI
ncbi:hypothetical protein BC938DRAFT_479272 [Jimgerdemannia flammicorona]|uniref:Uncharacterized protein n=1 Tax=Jimgerdemannia flammicorona TaxID=994334 RepID=A0A433QL77_9FUNG|nr:hypothetical protein BC938DRAFT_479272 [Jimgerdemannia flammicorona]